MITNKHTQTFEDCTVLYIKCKYAFIFNINTNYFYPVIIYTAEWVEMCQSGPQLDEMCNINDRQTEKIAEDLWRLDWNLQLGCVN